VIIKNNAMQTTTLLNAIYHLPIHDRMLIVERTIHSIRTENSKQEKDSVLTHFASEHVLAKGWLNQEEDEAWLTL
jgi:hypothetical protein